MSLPPLSRAAHDPDGDSRKDPELLARVAADRESAVMLVHRGEVAAGDQGLMLFSPQDLPEGALAVGSGRVVYLGRDPVPTGADDDGRAPRAYLALTLPADLGDERDLDGVPIAEDAALAELVASATWQHLRDVANSLSDRDAGLATTAIALAAWHARHPRCPRCGEPTVVEGAGWMRRCVSDGSQHFPRTDPAVIMTVTDARDRLLLGHAAHWPDRRFSTLAGFVESGESAEHAVVREVHEEVGLDVARVEYVVSQPWPFPCSLMLGFRAVLAEAPGVPEIAVDGEEITEARFFTRGELGAAARSGEIRLPSHASIARVLIEQWYGGTLPGPA